MWPQRRQGCWEIASWSLSPSRNACHPLIACPFGVTKPWSDQKKVPWKGGHILLLKCSVLTHFPGALCHPHSPLPRLSVLTHVEATMPSHWNGPMLLPVVVSLIPLTPSSLGISAPSWRVFPSQPHPDFSIPPAAAPLCSLKLSWLSPCPPLLKDLPWLPLPTG